MEGLLFIVRKAKYFERIMIFLSRQTMGNLLLFGADR